MTEAASLYQTMTPQASTPNATETPLSLQPQSIALALLLSAFAMVTVFGNSLVITAVLRERYLRTVTNYFIVSLATADLLMGAVVMPFAVVGHATAGRWPFGPVWCDLWHAFDVLSSTASILNLCMIAIERYWAIENPMSYPSKVTKRRCLAMIGTVWVCASLISFPAIAWWHAAEPRNHHEDGQPVCKFTIDPAYLVCSSIVSFYAPLLVMLFVYWKIYRTAVRLVRGWRSGAKVLRGRGVQTAVVLRIHRGGGGGGGGGDRRTANNGLSSCVGENGCFCEASVAASNTIGEEVEASEDDDSMIGGGGARSFARRLRSSFGVRKKLQRFSREQRAAKTLGVVMGVFIACWLPFFVCNVVAALSPRGLGDAEGSIFAVVAWLGYANSSVNPAIYAHSMRDFRRAFISLLSCRRRRQRSGLAPDSRSGGGGGGGLMVRRRHRQALPRSPALSACSTPTVQTPLHRLWPASPERVMEAQALLMRELRRGSPPSPCRLPPLSPPPMLVAPLPPMVAEDWDSHRAVSEPLKEVSAAKEASSSESQAAAT